MSAPPTRPADDLPEPKPKVGDQPEERLEFAIVPKENPDGTPLDPDETRRRLDAQRYLLEQRAHQCGLEIREVGYHPPTPQSATAHAHRLARDARPGMDKRANEIKERRNELKVASFRREKRPDGGTLTEFSLLHLASRETISDILGGIAGLAKRALPVGKVAIAIKVGWLRVFAGAQHEGESKSRGNGES